MIDVIKALNKFAMEYGSKNGYKSHQVTANGYGEPTKITFRTVVGSSTGDSVKVKVDDPKLKSDVRMSKYYEKVDIKLIDGVIHVVLRGKRAEKYIVERYYITSDLKRIPA